MRQIFVRDLWDDLRPPEAAVARVFGRGGALYQRRQGPLGLALQTCCDSSVPYNDGLLADAQAPRESHGAARGNAAVR